MAGFITVTGTVYYVDRVNNLITGGEIINPTPYTTLSALIGAPAIIYLVTGQVIITETVAGYI